MTAWCHCCDKRTRAMDEPPDEWLRCDRCEAIYTCHDCGLPTPDDAHLWCECDLDYWRAVPA